MQESGRTATSSDPLALAVGISVALVVVMAFAGVMWGLRLETKIERREAAMERLREEVSHGVLPVADARLNRLDDVARHAVMEHETIKIEIERLKLWLATLQEAVRKKPK